MDYLLFGAFPYVAIAIFLVGTIVRYKMRFKYSSLSSQFLETKRMFLSSVPFHVGILIVLIGHIIGFLFPSVLLSFGGSSLVNLEIVGLACGFAAIVGLISMLIRRFQSERLKVVTSKMDIAIELLLIGQFIVGVLIAIELKWGSAWFASNMTPYLWSLVAFDPQIDAVALMPLLVKLHIVLAFLIILLIPFSRLVHFLVAPFHYILRPYQVVRWYWNKKAIRDPNTPYSEARPKNN